MWHIHVLLRLNFFSVNNFQTDQCFSFREGLYITGLSAEALQNLLDDFLACGMYYYRLNIFSTPPVLDSFYKAGLTYNAFLGAIRNYLQYYRATVLSIPTTKTLLQLKVLCHKLIKQLRYVLFIFYDIQMKIMFCVKAS